MPTLLAANWVLPVDAPPIEGGGVLVDGERIVAVGSASELKVDSSVQVIDYGEAILMPGLVNVHTHLDYTLMRGLLEDIEFFPWIRELTARKSFITQEEWEASATIGAAEMLASGTTTIGDCCDSGAALIGAKRLGLRGRIYQEVFGIDLRETSVSEIVARLDHRIQELKVQAEGSRLEVGVSPHAPYTVAPELFKALADYGRANHFSLCIHASESQAESALFASGSGGIAEMFARRGIEWTPPGISVIAYLESLGCLSPETLLVHCVQMSASDRHVLKQTGAAVAHCPKSNAKLGNGIAPLNLLAGITMGLGSDSVASNNGADLFEEMRFAVLMQRAARRKISALGADQALKMATLGGAKALGMDKQIGSLTPGKFADLCVVDVGGLHALPVYHPANALVYSARGSDVMATWIGGEQVYSRDETEKFKGKFRCFNVDAVKEVFKRSVEKQILWGAELPTQ